MGDLSANFSLSEFECGCGCCPEVKASFLLWGGLQSLRDIVGVPIHINSGFRCPAHNKKEGGYEFSEHLKGLAADIVIEGFSSVEMFVVAEQIRAFREGGMGVYPEKGHLHVDVRQTKRARWGWKNLPQKKEK